MPYSSHALTYINPKAILSFPFHFVTKSDAFASFSQSVTCKLSLHFFLFFYIETSPIAVHLSDTSASEVICFCADIGYPRCKSNTYESEMQINL